jgi:hypothetical protein
MKTRALIVFFILLTGSLFCQNIHSEVDGNASDTLWWTSTEYPVRLKNDIADLQKEITDRLTLYPEDQDKSVTLTYKFKITLAGINIGSSLESHEGSGYSGLQERIKKILDEICTWNPAMEKEKPVNSYYSMTIEFRKGKIKVIPQIGG